MIKRVSYVLLLSTITIIILFAKETNNSKLNIKSPDFKVETFKTKDGGWGYNIIKSEKIIIKQDIIPAIPYNSSFKTKDDAKKTGLLMIKKLNEKKIPTIKTEELKQLKIATKN